MFVCVSVPLHPLIIVWQVDKQVFAQSFHSTFALRPGPQCVTYGAHIINTAAFDTEKCE